MARDNNRSMSHTLPQPVSEPEKRTPKHYAIAVHRHSLRSKEVSLYPGTNYRSLALFLNQPEQLPLREPRVREWRRHHYAVIHDLAFDPPRISHFDSLDGFDDFNTHPPPHDGCGQLLFLCGFPSPRWINTIGARYRVDPEVFRRFLTFNSAVNAYDLPGTASSSANIIKLTITSIAQPNVISHGDQLSGLEDYLEQLGSSSRLVGESIVRRFTTHDQENFSIEQNVLISVVRRENGWIALVLLDGGRDLDEGPTGPWSGGQLLQKSYGNIFHPVIQFEPRICFNKPATEISAESDLTKSTYRAYAQSSSLLPSMLYGQFLSTSSMRNDAFYAMHEVFRFAACAENQFLNFMESKYEDAMRKTDTIYDLRDALVLLRPHKLLLHSHLEQLQSVTAAVKRRGGPQWPRAKRTTRTLSRESSFEMGGSFEANEDLARVETAAALLSEEYDSLITKARNLYQLYGEGINEIRVLMQILESRKAIEQASRIARLTFLAFLFIPLSFTTSLFGMNVREIGQDLSIWIWVAVSAPIFFIALACYFWTRIMNLNRHGWKSLQDRWQKVFR